MTGRRFQGYDEARSSRRRRRELRQKRRRKKITGPFFQEYELPMSRRRRRHLRQEGQWRKWRGGLRELVATVFIALVVVFGFLRPFVVEAFRIPSESMVPTLEVGDRVLANKFVYRFHKPERGDIVIFDGVGGEEDQELIKRVVGLEGDTIQVNDNTLYVNGEPQKEPYLNAELPSKGSYGPTEVPRGQIFVMGDNRGNSSDSRVFGPVPLQNVRGEAFIRFWPVTKLGPLNPPA
ncbi:MAG TPA: signal peptidase I, partial [Rubrobacteraceae bacterium]|nr:signal peptidase I [Rubrobacteraceae bacterium]